jgi:hypothetical protein
MLSRGIIVFFLVFIFALLFGFFNPWSEFVRIISMLFLCLELLLLVILAIPRYFYLRVIKRKTHAESFAAAFYMLLPTGGGAA